MPTTPSVPEAVSTFIEAVRLAHAADSEIGQSANLLLQVQSIESDIRQAATDEDAARFSKALADAKEKHAFRELREEGYKRQAEAAWQTALQASRPALDAVSAIAEPLAGRCRAAAYRIARSLLSPAAVEAEKEPVNGAAYLQANNNAAGSLCGRTRVVWTIETDLFQKAQRMTTHGAPASAICSDRMTLLDETLPQLEDAKQEAERLEAAARAVEQIFGAV